MHTSRYANRRWFSDERKTCLPLLRVAFLRQCPHSLNPKGRRRTRNGEWQSRKQADGGDLAQLLAATNKENQSQFRKENAYKDLARFMMKGRNALNVVETTQFFSYLQLPEPLIIVAVSKQALDQGEVG